MRSLTSPGDPLLNLLNEEEREVIVSHLPLDPRQVAGVAEQEFLRDMRRNISDLDRLNSYRRKKIADFEAKYDKYIAKYLGRCYRFDTVIGKLQERSPLDDVMVRMVRCVFTKRISLRAKGIQLFRLLSEMRRYSYQINSLLPTENLEEQKYSSERESDYQKGLEELELNGQWLYEPLEWERVQRFLVVKFPHFHELQWFKQHPLRDEAYRNMGLAIFDKEISWKAKAIYIYLVLTDFHENSLSHVTAYAKESYLRVDTGLNELIREQYLNLDENSISESDMQ